MIPKTPEAKLAIRDFDFAWQEFESHKNEKVLVQSLMFTAGTLNIDSERFIDEFSKWMEVNNYYRAKKLCALAVKAHEENEKVRSKVKPVMWILLIMAAILLFGSVVCALILFFIVK